MSITNKVYRITEKAELLVQPVIRNTNPVLQQQEVAR